LKAVLGYRRGKALLEAICDTVRVYSGSGDDSAAAMNVSVTAMVTIVVAIAMALKVWVTSAVVVATTIAMVRRWRWLSHAVLIAVARRRIMRGRRKGREVTDIIWRLLLS